MIVFFFFFKLVKGVSQVAQVFTIITGSCSSSNNNNTTSIKPGFLVSRFDKPDETRTVSSREIYLRAETEFFKAHSQPFKLHVNKNAH